jgi:hypothetical protein
MPRPAGTPKTGGRQKGTVNKRTAEVRDVLDRLQCDPIQVLAWLAMGDRKALGSKRAVPLDLRLWAAKELAQYVAPKLAAVRIEAEVKTETTLRAVIETPARLLPSQWEAAASLSRGADDGSHRVEPAHPSAG